MTDIETVYENCSCYILYSNLKNTHQVEWIKQTFVISSSYYFKLYLPSYLIDRKIGVISIFLRAIVLKTISPTEHTYNPAFHINSPTKSILAAFSPTNCWSYSMVGLYSGQDQCIISHTISRTIDTMVETSVS